MSTSDPNAVKRVQAALQAAKAGGATLSQLYEAHSLAEKMGAPHTVAELRMHMREMLPDTSVSRLNATRSVLLGVISGIFTHMLLTVVARKSAGRPLTRSEIARIHG